MLPIDLDWSQQRRYDLAVDKDRRRLHETVIREAMSLDALCSFLNADLLVRLWPTPWLPPQVWRLWEERFPELRHRAAA
ncbi:transcriptional regulator [Streptomyces sodiiphilus]|uniref:transcriptional regulator n=1 Tax=Streptomyces sodiiphilus TaxID=226217 RepID=UPI0031CF5559